MNDIDVGDSLGAIGGSFDVVDLISCMADFIGVQSFF